MGSGSKSRVRVGFESGSGTIFRVRVGFGYQICRVFFGFWGILATRIHHYRWVRVAKVGFGSGSSTISRVRVGFGYQKSRVFPPGFGFSGFFPRVSSGLMQSRSKSRVRVAKRLGFSPGFRVFGFGYPSLAVIHEKRWQANFSRQ